MILNLADDPNYELEVIRQGASTGLNSILLTIAWDKVYQQSPTGPANWARFDNQIKLAKDLGMKVAIRVMVGRGSHNLNGFWDLKTQSALDYKQNPMLEVYNTTHFSFLHQPSVELAADFVKQVADRYKYLLADNSLLFMSVANNPTQELGYHMLTIPPSGEYSEMYHTIFDYSSFYKQGFREWARSKYKKLIRLNRLWGSDYKAFENIEPPVAYWDPKESFFGRKGKDWYIFRHEALKKYNDLCIKTIKGVDPRIRYINEFGAVVDIASGIRGSLAFKNLGEHTDGTKVNDGHGYDHHWSIDVVRSNVKPGHWVMNEVFYADFKPASEYYRHIDGSFQNGANLVAFVLSTPRDVQAMREVIVNSVQKWSHVPLEPVLARDTVTYLLSRAIDRGAEEVAYGIWKNLSNSGDGTIRPVHVQLQEDILSEEYWKAAENTPPYLQNPIPMRIIAIDRDFSYRIPDNTFADYDGVIVRLEVAQVPAWMKYEAGVFSGRPTALGDHRIMVRAIDDEGGSSEAYFTIRVDTRENANQPPTVAKNFPSLVAVVNEPFTYTIPKEAFVDSDGSITSVEVTELPAWLRYQNGVLTGVPPLTGEFRTGVKAYDDLGAFVETYLTIRVVEPQYFNNPPYVQSTIPVKFAKVNEPFTYTLPTNIFGDSDGYISFITVQDLPGWMSFSDNTFSGTPPQEGQYRFTVRGYDNGGHHAETPFILNVEIPQLTFDLLRAGKAIDRQRIQILQPGDLLSVDSLPSLLNIYAYGNFEFDRLNFQLQGPYRHESAAPRFPHALFPGEQGFAPYIGQYTLTAFAFKEDSMVLTNEVQFSIIAGDSTDVTGNLSAWQYYPNPFDGVFNIKLPNPTTAADYDFSLITALGQRIPISQGSIAMFGDVAMVDLTSLSLSAGVYYIQVAAAGEVLQTIRVAKY
ncbi:hypothetical protein GCM10027275_28270 [Rhabdobacter roseus]